MLKKALIALIAVAMTLTGLALAETYSYPDWDLRFTYDTDSFEITMEDETDDELMVLLAGKNADWGETGIRILLHELDEVEGFPTPEDFAELEAALNTEVEQGDWNGFQDVYMYSIDDGETLEQTFVAPVYDAGELEDILTVTVSVARLDDEAAGMSRDDAISALLDTLEVLDD